MAPAASKVTSSNKIYFNPQDSLRGLKIDSTGLTCDSAAAKAWNGSRTNAGVSSGKFYYEVKIINGLCRVGWSTENGNLNLGTCQQGFGYGGTGKKSNNMKFDDYGETFSDNDIIGCYLDKDNGIISYTKNGKDLGVAFKFSLKVYFILLLLYRMFYIQLFVLKVVHYQQILVLFHFNIHLQINHLLD